MKITDDLSVKEINRALEVEMGIAPSLDYLTQYAVEEVAVPKKGDGWQIVFSNGARVTNLKEGLPAPSQIVGTILVMTIHSVSSTRARFGLPVPETGDILNETWVEWEATEEGARTYEISDPRFPAETEPGQPEVVAELEPVEGSREAEGPDEDWLAEQRARAAEAAREAAKLSRHEFVQGDPDTDTFPNCDYCGMLENDQIHNTGEPES